MNIQQNVSIEKKAHSIYDAVANDYEILANNLPNFKKRKGQEKIMQSCASSINNNELLATQAGTGTGKTFAYLLASLPFVRDQNKHLIISTNTVALQSQLIEKDIPVIVKHLAPELNVAIAKGSSRYLCPNRMFKLLSTPDQKSMLADDNDINATDIKTHIATDSDIEIIKNILNDYNSGDFTGDLDTLTYKNAEKIPAIIGRNHLSCPGKAACINGKSCPYYIQRSKIAEADIVVTNHALLSHTALSGSSMLSRSGDILENSIFIIDEAHQFPSALQNANQSELNIKLAKTWLKTTSTLRSQSIKIENNEIGKKVISNVDDFTNDTKAIKEIGEECIVKIKKMDVFLRNNFEKLKESDDILSQNKIRGNDQWVLSPKKMNTSFTEEINILADVFSRLNTLIETANTKYSVKFTTSLEGHTNKKLAVITNWLTSLRTLNQETSAACKCLKRYIDYMKISSDFELATSGIARWITASPDLNDFSLFSNTIDVSKQFQDSIVKNSIATILTSATLDALGDFDFFNSRLGITSSLKEHRFEKVDSPFDYSKTNVIIPNISEDPNSPKHCYNIIEQVIGATRKNKSMLVLFGSNKQMNETYNICSKELKDNILVQHNYSKSELIRLHKSNVDNNKTSILFGVAGLAEGLDLQQQYLTCVIITKMPFPNPSNPMFNYESRCMDILGKSSFLNLSLPLCSRNLIQAAGRLIRTEEDYGDIYILDSRIRKSRYGSNLLGHLPMKTTSLF